jgi:hypothetical protein
VVDPAAPAGAGPPPRWRTLGRLAPAVLAAWFVTDAGLRFVSPTRLWVNPIGAALRAPRAYVSFEPDYSASTTNYVGDAVAEVNGRQTEYRPPVRFSTDGLGFRRNPYVTPDEPYEVLQLGGASFGFGGALSDEETLPAAITRASGLRVYNGGMWPQDRLSPGLLDHLLARLAGRPRAALFLVVEHEQLQVPQARGRTRDAIVRAFPPLAPAARVASDLTAAAFEAMRRWDRWVEYSPIQIASEKLSRLLSNDRVLPNEYARGTRTLTLPDGRPMYIRRYELGPIARERSPADVPGAAEYLTWWRDSLAARGIVTHVLLVPSRYTVYGPLLEREPERLAAIGRVAAYIDSLDATLRARGIGTINAHHIFRRRAAEELRTGELSFYREDNHWNPSGVEIVARAVADSLASCRYAVATPGGTSGEAAGGRRAGPFCPADAPTADEAESR